MALDSDYYGSFDESTYYGSAPGTSGINTPSATIDDTAMAGNDRPKKNVKWSLGDEPLEDQSPSDVYHDPIMDGRASTADAGHQTRNNSDDDRRQHEALRGQLTQILSHSASIDNNDGANVHRSSVESSRGLPTKPRSALRSGTSTPVVTISPPPELAKHVDGQEDKNRSADLAKRNAEYLSRALAEETKRPHKRRSHWRSLFQGRRSRSRDMSPEPTMSLYHDGGELLESGQVTPYAGMDSDYAAKPTKYRLAGLSAQQAQDKLANSSRRSSTDSEAPSPAGLTPQRPGWAHSPRGSITSIAGLIQSSSAQLGSIGGSSVAKKITDNARALRPNNLRSQSDPDGTPNMYASNSPRNSTANLLQGVETLYQKALNPAKKKRHKEDIRIKLHIKETVLRQRYLRHLCRAFMEYGAPTHRLESYMRISSRVLDIEAAWLYLPGCMLVSFDDSRSHTSDVKLVRVSEGVDLGKLRDTHDVYKQVVHDKMGVDEAMSKLTAIRERKIKFNKWVAIIAHGFASAGVAPFAFKGNLIDLPIAFLLGLLLGFLRLIVSTKSELYASIFEVSSVVVTSAISRAVGSIRGGNMFCFSALAQSSIVLILPGYIVLCGALELQSRSLVAGSVRLVYAVIYSLFIGFGLTIGTAIVGWTDHTAVSDSTCRRPMPEYWYFFFVPPFAFALMVINQAKWKQMPIMMLIACTGYFISFSIAKYLPDNAPVSSAAAAVAISILANIYSRVGDRLDKPFADFVHKTRAALTGNTATSADEEDQQDSGVEKGHAHHGRISSTSSDISLTGLDEFGAAINSEYEDDDRENGRDKSVDSKEKDRPQVRVNYSPAAAVMLPAIFVLVPSGLSVSGSLVQGIADANNLTHNTTMSAGPQMQQFTLNNNGAFVVGLNVVQVAIGISVGLFIGTVAIYPFGKGGKWGQARNTRSGLFTF